MGNNWHIRENRNTFISAYKRAQTYFGNTQCTVFANSNWLIVVTRCFYIRQGPPKRVVRSVIMHKNSKGFCFLFKYECAEYRSVFGVTIWHSKCMMKYCTEYNTGRRLLTNNNRPTVRALRTDTTSGALNAWRTGRTNSDRRRWTWFTTRSSRT